MSREWKPGDVVSATVGGRPNVRLVAGWSKYDPRLRWCELSPRWADGDDDDCWFMPAQVADARPLVVIDPTDRVQVERLRDLWDEAHEDQQGHKPSQSAKGARGNALQAALREFADPKPPKPEEPTGLGAVVEDEVGVLWVRDADRSERWFSGPASAIPRRVTWDEIDAVRVLSEGVTS
jgi:hypothetical protein